MIQKKIAHNPLGAHVAVVGATGAVGREMLHCLEALKFPVREIDLLASKRGYAMGPQDDSDCSGV